MSFTNLGYCVRFSVVHFRHVPVLGSSPDNPVNILHLLLGELLSHASIPCVQQPLSPLSATLFLREASWPQYKLCIEPRNNCETTKWKPVGS